MTTQNTEPRATSASSFETIRRVDRDWSKVRGVVRTVDQQAEQNTAWLAMFLYMAAMPLAALAGFVLYVGMF